jgi:hypothetical protein
MTDTGNDIPLQDLEPLDPAAGVAPEAIEAAVAAQMQSFQQGPSAGLPSPAFNPRCTDKSSYKFLMCGVLMLLGCTMPFSADLNLAGYKTISGAFFTFLAIGMVWTWWSAIHHNRATSASMKWIGLCMFPLLAQVMNLINFDAAKASTDAIANGFVHGLPALTDGYTLSNLFSDMGTGLGKDIDTAPQAAARCEMFFRSFGTGRFFVLLGALLTEVYFILGVVGGAKKIKEQKAARQAQAAGDRKRR